MWPRGMAMIGSAWVVLFVLRAVGGKPYNSSQRALRSCEDFLVFDVIYADGSAKHNFRMRLGDTLFTATDNCTSETVRVSSTIQEMNISTELDFLRRQWSGLRQTSVKSPLLNTTLALHYQFDPYSREYTFYLSSNEQVVVYCCERDSPVFAGDYGSDELAKICANGIALNVLRSGALDLAKKWTSCCEQLKVGMSCVTKAPIPPMWKMTGGEHASAASNASAIERKDSLCAKDTGYIVTIVLFVTVIAGAVIARKYGDALRNVFRRVTARG